MYTDSLRFCKRLFSLCLCVQSACEGTAHQDDGEKRTDCGCFKEEMNTFSFHVSHCNYVYACIYRFMTHLKNEKDNVQNHEHVFLTVKHNTKCTIVFLWGQLKNGKCGGGHFETSGH